MAGRSGGGTARANDRHGYSYRRWGAAAPREVAELQQLLRVEEGMDFAERMLAERSGS
jgi:hypothetical protein